MSRATASWVVVLLLCSVWIIIPINAQNRFNFDWNYTFALGASSLNETGSLINPVDFILDSTDVYILSSSDDSRLTQSILQYDKGSRQTYSNASRQYSLSNQGNLFHSISNFNLSDAIVFGGDGSIVLGTKSLDYRSIPIPLNINASIFGLYYKDNQLYMTLNDVVRSAQTDAIRMAQSQSSSLTLTPSPYFVVPGSNRTPTKMRKGCNGDLWVAYNSGAIFKYTDLGMYAQVVLGRNGTRLEVNSLGWPNDNSLRDYTDIVFTKECTHAFVADYTRVLRYEAPFETGKAAQGVLGANDFFESNFSTRLLDGSTFKDILRLQLEDFNNGSGILYILDSTNKRIIGGYTQWGNVSSSNTTSNTTASGLPPLSVTPSKSPSSSSATDSTRSPSFLFSNTRSTTPLPSPTPSPSPRNVFSNNTVNPFLCDPFPSIVSQLCEVDDGVVLPENATSIFNGSLLVINDILTITNNSALQISSEQQIIVSGAVTLGGTLVIILSSSAQQQLAENKTVEVMVIQSNTSISGEFITLIVVNEDKKQCGTEGEAEYTGNSMSVLITTERCVGSVGAGDGDNNNRNDDKKLGGGAVAGIVIGVVGGAVIFGSLLALGCFFLIRYIKKPRTIGAARV